MAHIAIFLMPERGHFLPALGMIAELVRRGHRVSVPATARFAAAVAECGATAIPCTSTLPDDLPGSLLDTARLALAEAESALPQLEGTFRDDPPDFVVWDIAAWCGGVIAHRLEVPNALLEVLLTSNEHWSLGTELVPPSTFDPAVIRLFTRLHAFIGSSLPEFVAGAHRRIALFPREFQPHGDTFGEHVTFAGPCLTGREFQGTWEPPADRPVVLATTGTQVCADAARGMPWHLVTKGKVLSPSLNVETHDEVPQLAVLRRASVFVTRGGMGGVMEALHHGVPMIVIPHMADQRLNGQRVEELGLGVLLDTVTVEGVRSLVGQLSSDSAISARVKDMQRMIHRAGGSTAAADVVEEELAR
ncbi:nucleotide disphospho-sugar-binding domain-containing protein [Lentzea sp. NBRC 102530]|uniref:nucleotide disphospho-sugar-binding domain-containing protein n=1 Tax=Lentzea sp. NBRC 102530 TaxID=3032201 RepID=UPI0024A0310A|nr:nucleotide disphospho-sugar-binding domain-containing protein [Lentzea sp. NBRC 102530]GLY48658.1 glycosyl transferase [Lentzea sp. NBRC 102530]